MKIAIVYSSVTGNTKELAEVIYRNFLGYSLDVMIYRIEDFSPAYIDRFDVVVVGTYTWGDGEIPKEMRKLYYAFEKLGNKKIISGVFGTGDSFYPKYCGAVDLFRDMLYVRTNLTATLKVELLPQIQDLQRSQMFVDSILKRADKLNNSFKMKDIQYK
ncbi:flavodoxin domain-containing protein [Neobacillus cucumis]|uniref:Flavodoxin n=1 Tax=Neobacillus cucumis TaxID=1740721 RepID=A0A2N5H8M8_9BACI|nr:flavodoxin domain-containing protein [Neobacillus cucumis]PLS01873.1 flavodoxin [Neobacillus cucumis]